MDPTVETVMTALTELRKEVEKKGFIDKEKVERLQKVLDQTEAKSAEITALNQAKDALETDVKELKALKTQYEEARKVDELSAAEFKGRLDQLEADIARGIQRVDGNDDGKFRETDGYKALVEYCVKGDDMNLELKVELRTDDATAGGVLTTTELDNVITKQIIEIDPIRSLARVRTISSKSISVVKRTGVPIAQFEGEAEEGVESQATYGLETITPFRLTHTTPITKDLLQDAEFDMEGEIIADGSEAFAFGEGNGFVLGTGFKQPQGIFVNALLQAAARDTAAAGILDADAVILMTGDVKTGYNLSYLLNRRTLATIRTFKSTTGQFLWQPGLSGPVANTLNGLPYALGNSVPDIALGAFAMAVGDFRRGYLIVDRTGMEIVRDALAQKKKAIVEFLLMRYTTGQVVQDEAIKLLRILP
ncbi:MAG: phage major capsid protein [Armatimonadetes bacterium]|nr:phage major capsid protein [Armatimonadota bacterium]